MKNEAHILGCRGEELVTRFLERKGYRIIARNYQARVRGMQVGEIDIIAQKEEILAFVEVKTRKLVYFPIATVVTPTKQRKLIKAGKLFMVQRGLYYKRVGRFDVATVVCSDRGDHDIEYIENAF